MDAESEIEGPFADDLSQVNLAIGRLPSGSKRPSHSGDGYDEPLLPRRASSGSYARGHRIDSRFNQKIYIASEDMTIVFAGFSTRFGGFLLYTTFCVLTFGLAYLLFRWFPRWRVELIGRPTPLGKCEWVAIEVSSLSCTVYGCHPAKPQRTNGTNSLCRKFLAKRMAALSLLSSPIRRSIYMTRTMIRRSFIYDILITNIYGFVITHLRISSSC